MTYAQRLVLVTATAATVAFGQAALFAQAPAGGGAPARFIRDPAIQAAYENGMKLLGEEKPKEALAQFNKALNGDSTVKGDPTFAEALLGKGDALKATEELQGAAVAYTDAINIDQNMAAAYNGRGEVLLKVPNQVDGASADFARALELDPNNPVILSNLGHILINYSRDPVAAIRRLDDALAQNDQDARAFRDRGYAHALLQDFEKAEADLKKAAEVEPGDFENFAMMANIYLFQENFESAIGALTKAIEAYKPKLATDPKKYLDGYLSRTDAWLRIGGNEADKSKAEAALKNAIADADAVIADNPDRFPQAGQAQFRKGRAQRLLELYAEAVDSFTLALENIPPGQEATYVADAYMYRGVCWYYIGSFELARGDFEQASAVGGGFQDPRVFLWIGHTHHKQGDYRDAIESYSEAIAKAPNFAIAHVNKGRAYMDLDEYRRAIESFNDAIRAEPSVGENYYNVGVANVKLRDFEKAEHFLNIALRKENPQPKFYSLMATVLRERGRNDQAAEYDRKAAAAKAQAAGG